MKNEILEIFKANKIELSDIAKAIFTIDRITRIVAYVKKDKGEFSEEQAIELVKTNTSILAGIINSIGVEGSDLDESKYQDLKPEIKDFIEALALLEKAVKILSVVLKNIGKLTPELEKASEANVKSLLQIATNIGLEASEPNMQAKLEPKKQTKKKVKK